MLRSGLLKSISIHLDKNVKRTSTILSNQWAELAAATANRALRSEDSTVLMRTQEFPSKFKTTLSTRLKRSKHKLNGVTKLWILL